MFDKKDITLFNQSIQWIEETFCIDKLKINNLIEVKESFYNENIHAHIDLVQQKILSGNNFLNKSDKEKKEVMYKIFGITEIDNLYQIIHNHLLLLYVLI